MKKGDRRIEQLGWKRRFGREWATGPDRRGRVSTSAMSVSRLSAVRVGIDPKLMGQKVYSVARRCSGWGLVKRHPWCDI